MRDEGVFSNFHIVKQCLILRLVHACRPSAALHCAAAGSLRVMAPPNVLDTRRWCAHEAAANLVCAWCAFTLSNVSSQNLVILVAIGSTVGLAGGADSSSVAARAAADWLIVIERPEAVWSVYSVAISGGDGVCDDVLDWRVG